MYWVEIEEAYRDFCYQCRFFRPECQTEYKCLLNECIYYTDYAAYVIPNNCPLNNHKEE